jgi:hypothetical protein
MGSLRQWLHHLGAIGSLCWHYANGCFGLVNAHPNGILRFRYRLFRTALQGLALTKQQCAELWPAVGSQQPCSNSTHHGPRQNTSNEGPDIVLRLHCTHGDGSFTVTARSRLQFTALEHR